MWLTSPDGPTQELTPSPGTDTNPGYKLLINRKQKGYVEIQNAF